MQSEEKFDLEIIPTKNMIDFQERIDKKDLFVFKNITCEDYNKKYGTKLKDVPKIPREIFYSANPEDQEKVAEYRKLIKEIRQNNLYEIYKKEYVLELYKKHEQQHESNHILEKSDKDDFDL